jgi:hypothetical protein
MAVPELGTSIQKTCSLINKEMQVDNISREKLLHMIMGK